MLQLLKFIQKHKKLSLAFITFAVIAGVFGDVNPLYALQEGGGGGGASTPSADDSDTVTKIFQGLNALIGGLAAIMGLITSLISIFLYPGWVNGTMFGLQDYLKEIWILVSNIVYFIFAFILIAIAFMNIIGKGENNWELRQALPKFIVGVLMVPFSWFFVQFALAISSVLTVGVLTLPYDVFESKSNFQLLVDQTEKAAEEGGYQSLIHETICTDVVVSLTGEFTDASGAKVDTESIGESSNGEVDEKVKCKAGSNITIKEFLTGKMDNGSNSNTASGVKNSIFGIMSIYTYGILKIDEIDTFKQENFTGAGAATKVVDLIFKVIFDLIFVLVYLILMVALFLALFIRGVRLWIYMMLSPAFGLLYFFGKAGEGIGDENNKFSITEFIALALVPVYVAAALSFGFIFILVASEGVNKNPDNPNTIETGGFSLTVLGLHGGQDENVEKNPLAKLIIEMFGIVILWIAVMSALKTSSTTKTIIAPIEQFGNNVGQMAAKAPTYAPIIPTPQGGMSAAGLAQASSTLSSSIDAGARERGSDFIKPFLPDSENQIDLTQHSINALRAHEAAGNVVNQDVLDKLKSAVAAGGSIGTLSQNRDFLEAINFMASNDSKFKDNTAIQGILRDAGGRIDQNDQNQLAQILSEMDKVIDLEYSNLRGTILPGQIAGGSSTLASVDERLAGNTSTVENTINIGDSTISLPSNLMSGDNVNNTAINNLVQEIGSDNVSSHIDTIMSGLEDLKDSNGDEVYEDIQKIREALESAAAKSGGDSSADAE